MRTLGSDNGVLRDLAHRLVLERGSKEIEAIKALARDGKQPAVRLQALYLLEQLHSLDDSILRQSLADRHPAVRAAAVKLSERRPSFARELEGLASDSDPALRLQLAFSLGEFEAPEAAATLGKIARATLADPRMRYAVLSSATRAPAPVLEEVLGVAPSEPGRREMVDGLIRTAGANSDANVRQTVLNLVLPTSPHKPFIINDLQIYFRYLVVDY